MTLLISLFLCLANPTDEDLIKSLTIYVDYEHAQIKKTIEQQDSVVFNWSLCSFSSFPIIQGKRCPYFPDRSKYKARSTFYMAESDLIYVGIKYWFNSSDTINYRVVAYKFKKTIQKPPYYVWSRSSNVMTITACQDKILQIDGEEIY